MKIVYFTILIVLAFWLGGCAVVKFDKNVNINGVNNHMEGGAITVLGVGIPGGATVVMVNGDRATMVREEPTVVRGGGYTPSYRSSYPYYYGGRVNRDYHNRRRVIWSRPVLRVRPVYRRH